MELDRAKEIIEAVASRNTGRPGENKRGQHPGQRGRLPILRCPRGR